MPPDLALNQSAAKDIRADPELPQHAPGPECQISAANETHAVVPKNLSIYLCLKHLVLGSGSSPDQADELEIFNSTVAGCVDIQRTSEEFRTAFWDNVICIALPIVVFYIMCFQQLWVELKRLEHRRSGSQFILLLRIFYVPLGILCAPFFIIYVAVRQLVFKFYHSKAKTKKQFRKQLMKSEYLWGISQMAEAALESCGQLILQIWLLSSDFYAQSSNTFADLIDKTYDGVIFFLSFSIKEATDIEKSLGKIFMSLVVLVCGVAASYRTLKRGAVVWTNTIPYPRNR